MRILALLIWIYYNALNQQQVAMRDDDWKSSSPSSLSPELKASINTTPIKSKTPPLTDIRSLRSPMTLKRKRNSLPPTPQKLAELTKKLTKHFEELVHNSHVWGQSK